MAKQFILISLLITCGLIKIAFAQDTGPALPKPTLIPTTTGSITVKTMTVDEISTHIMALDDDAAKPLYNSLKSAPANKKPQLRSAEDIRIGRNVKCISRMTLIGLGLKQKISCELSITDGEYLDLLAGQIPEIKLQTVKISTATVRTQVRGDSIQMTIVGLLPKSKAVREIYDSLVVTEEDSTKTKNMISCSQIPNPFDPNSDLTVTCTTIFKDGVALIAPVKK